MYISIDELKISLFIAPYRNCIDEYVFLSLIQLILLYVKCNPMPWFYGDLRSKNLYISNNDVPFCDKYHDYYELYQESQFPTGSIYKWRLDFYFL